MKPTPADLRTRGYKRCLMPVRTTNAPDQSVNRHGRKAGEQCKTMVPPATIQARGASVCDHHWPDYMKAVGAEAARRKAVRAKLDPGPQYEDLL